jgi:hypothetical protein
MSGYGWLFKRMQKFAFLALASEREVAKSMVLIINGEIIADDDPRAVQKRGGGSAQPRASAPQGSGPNLQGLGGSGQSRPGAAGQGAGAGAGGSPLDAIAEMIGIQGQTFLIPAVASIPARDVPLVVLLILAVMTLLVGWKVLAGAAALHVFSGLSGQGAAPGAGAARAGGRAGGGAGGGVGGGRPA